MSAGITRSVLGTLSGIADALASADVDDDDLYAVADALQAARNAVLDEALRRLATAEGYRIAAEYRRAHPRPDGVPAR
ncbi:hypothetical protein Q8W71_29770 [Methylobacterium sp. NEAU 140]|uniref:hypothetical protein n=1 Tax=Methylobacterium sp. NEAU 140 TaxID=3064945 RepID=UPI002736512A|nr:hypothetical protein [Methylobacterium sp. NEAU 140]MDP4026797.1 hypothetical protein [Methylobacterium sp. NEAU 140]